MEYELMIANGGINYMYVNAKPASIVSVCVHACVHMCMWFTPILLYEHVKENNVYVCQFGMVAVYLVHYKIWQ